MPSLTLVGMDIFSWTSPLRTARRDRPPNLAVTGRR
jgi:hypothetical protein